MRANERLQDLPEEIIFGRSEEMARLRIYVLRVAPTDAPILILGESGTGKEVIARALHAHSLRSSNAFVKVNCPAIPGTLLESELFGYEQGAFTGAFEAKAGLVDLAENGTLFLDEIGDMEQPLQAKLLQLLQDGAYLRIGGQEERHANLRIICATNRPLQDAIESGAFRRDLFYRINVITITMPPLSRRREDIPVLVRHFMKRYQLEYDTAVEDVSPALMRLFLQYNWPGNIRELENLVKRYVILGSAATVANDLLGRGPTPPIDGNTSLKALTREAVRELERKIILGVLYDNNWNRKRAAEILKISYRALFYKIKDAGVPNKRRRLPKSAGQPGGDRPAV